MTSSKTTLALRLILALALFVPQTALASAVQIGAVNTSIGAGSAAGTAGAGMGINTIQSGTSLMRTPSASLGLTLPTMRSLTPTTAESVSRMSAVGTPGAIAAPSAIKSRSVQGRFAAPGGQGIANTRMTPAKQPAAVSALGNAAKGLTPSKADSKGGPAAVNGMFSTLRRMFDGAGISEAEEEYEPAAVNGRSAPISEDEAEPLDMYFGRAVAKKMARSEIFTNIGLIKNSGSAFYWDKFAPNVPVRVLVGGRMMYFTRIIKGTTKEIGELTRKDFEGYYSKRIVYGKKNGKYANGIKDLRDRLLGEMRRKAFYSANGPRAVTPHTQVRVVRFMSFKEARHLPENNNEPDMSPRRRKPVDIPEKLKGLSNYLPRMVLIDIRGMDRISFDVLEDMGKLQKAGMTFVLLSDKSQDEVDKIIVRDLTLRQRDDVVRWKLYSLSNDGNTLYQYGGSFSQLIRSESFTALQLDILKRAAAATRSGVVLESKGYGLTIRPKRGVDMAALSKELVANLKRFGLKEGDFALNSDGETISVRPKSLATSGPGLIEGMQTEAGLYMNNEHIMTVSGDKSFTAQFPGALHFNEHAKDVKAEDMLETATAALLGPYRDNVQGDLAASASSLKSFKAGYTNSGGGFRYKIYMLLGHVLHTALDWAVMEYNATGRFPTEDEVRVKAHEIWKHEINQQVASLLEHPGESVAGYMEAMDKRLIDMHRYTAEMIKSYPIVLGTEIPNLRVVERFKKGEFTHRDIFRGLNDLVLAREVNGGLEVVVVDFKTGQTPTIPLLAKDTQVLLYDFFARVQWANVPAPFNVKNVMRKMMNHFTAFLYPSGIEAPEITEWDRVWFEKFLASLMNRMRKFKGIKTQEQIGKEIRKAELEAKRAVREAKKAAKAKAAPKAKTASKAKKSK